MNVFNSESLEDRLIATRRRPSGFDYMRIVLAALVLVVHTLNVVAGQALSTAVWQGPVRPFMVAILPMFFALSGFLVAGSLERCRTLISFLGLRIMRIVPALAVEVFLSALLLGPIFTSLPLGQYFTNAHLYAYFLNILGDVHLELPGVFLHNVWPQTVNLQLWVLPRELKCYILLALMFMVGLVRPNRQTLVFAVLFYVAAALYYSLSSAIHTGDMPNTLSGWLLIISFVVGVCTYVYRRQIPYSLPLFGACVAFMAFCSVVPGGDTFIPVPLTYITVYLGLRNPARSQIILSGDYSYGIYLYGFPIQQAVAALGPWTAHWYMNLALAAPCATLLAVASWWLVEKPVLRLRPLLTRLEDRALALRDGLRSYWIDWVRRALSNE
jgi:peptidoglycan/LPS O-acetylase OafA/YrhL